MAGEEPLAKLDKYSLILLSIAMERHFNFFSECNVSPLEDFEQRMHDLISILEK